MITDMFTEELIKDREKQIIQAQEKIELIGEKGGRYYLYLDGEERREVTEAILSDSKLIVSICQKLITSYRNPLSNDKML